MFRSKSPTELLPWYVNGTLPPAERRAVESWLRQQPEAGKELQAWEQVRAVIASQPQRLPPPALQAQVLARVRAEAARQPAPTRRPWLAWAWGAAMAMVVLALLWATVQPGMTLQWTANNGPLTAFRVYRAPLGSADFALVQQVPAQPDRQQYTFIDTFLLPWQTYIYIVEGENQAGQRIPSQAITDNALDALPYQAAIVALSVIMGYVAAMLAQQVQSAVLTRLH